MWIYERYLYSSYKRYFYYVETKASALFSFRQGSQSFNLRIWTTHSSHQWVYNMHTNNNNKTAYLHSLLTSTLQNWFQLKETIIFGHNTNCPLTEYYLNGEPNRKSCFWTEIFLNGSVNKNQTWLIRMYSSLHLVKYMNWILNPDHGKASKFKV